MVYTAFVCLHVQCTCIRILFVQLSSRGKLFKTKRTEESEKHKEINSFTYKKKQPQFFFVATVNLARISRYHSVLFHSFDGNLYSSVVAMLF